MDVEIMDFLMLILFLGVLLNSCNPTVYLSHHLWLHAVLCLPLQLLCIFFFILQTGLQPISDERWWKQESFDFLFMSRRHFQWLCGVFCSFFFFGSFFFLQMLFIRVTFYSSLAKVFYFVMKECWIFFRFFFCIDWATRNLSPLICSWSELLWFWAFYSLC